MNNALLRKGPFNCDDLLSLPLFWQNRARSRVESTLVHQLMVLVASIGILVAPGQSFAFTIGSPTTIGAIHENITREGLGFLEEDFYESAVQGNYMLDFTTGLGLATNYPSWHFDNCAFGQTINNINGYYSIALGYYRDWLGDPETTIEDLWDNTNQILYQDPDTVFGMFGFLLHPVQDFYSHTNWVELRAQGFVEATLFDTSLAPWMSTSNWYEHPLHQNLVVAEGSTATVPAGWDVSFLSGPDATSAGKTMKIVKADNSVKYGLVSGFYAYDEDPTGADMHDTVRWEHGDHINASDNVSLNHDTPININALTGAGDGSPRPLYKTAGNLAVLQTAHEWERLVTMIRDDPTLGPAAADLLENIAINYQTQIYVDRNDPNFVDWSQGGGGLIFSTNYRQPEGTTDRPFRWVSVAALAAAPSGATIKIKPGTYPGTRRIGRPGRSVRLEKWAGSGTIRITR